MKQTFRKCPKCGTVNENQDYCQNCGALINTILKRKLERQQRKEDKRKKAALEEPNAFTAWFERAKTHPNVLIRYTTKFFYSIWILFIAIGVGLALVVSYIAA